MDFVVPERYPAAGYLCALARHLEREGWRGLREDALNPGNPNSLVNGWGEFVDSTRRPETRVHAWSAEWLNERGDLLFYALRYEYPDHASPDLSQLTVNASRWPGDVASGRLGARAEQLRPLATIGDGRRSAGSAAERDECAEPSWTEFVRSATRGAPDLALPYELAHARSIDVVRDIDGLAKRIADALQARVPDIRVATVHDMTSRPADAYLDFRFQSRCNERGVPDGLFVTEVVLYKPAIERAGKWTEPARVLFHWTDGGDPAWRRVPAECFAKGRVAPRCTAALERADIAFVDALASALLGR